jgi:hypothetical protein
MNNTFDIINGRKYKKCKENQIRNPKTNRCIKNKLFNYFINRININNQISNIDLTNNNDCMKLYKYDKDGKPSYIIGDKIILQKQIGIESNNGIIFLANLKDNKSLKFAIKCVPLTAPNKKEIKLLKIILKSVLNNKCQHLPILYSVIECKDFIDLNNIKNYPKIIQKNKKKPFYFILNELANGNLKIFLEKYHNDYNLLLNTFTQIYLSLMFFYKETKHFHYDAHWGNFLYHKIKPGGYFHYNILGTDYYIKNYGYLWIIWDYGNAVEFKKSRNELIYVNNDFKHIITAFFNNNDIAKKGWLPSQYLLNSKFKKIIEKINKELFIDTLKEFNFIYQNKVHPEIFKNYTRIFNIYSELPKEQYKTPDEYQNMIIYSKSNMNDMIQFIMNILNKNKVLKTSIKPNEKIINEKPYIIP